MTADSRDEPGTRTRQSWLRTGLGIVAVTLLVLRGLIVAGLPTAIVVLGVLPGVVLTTAAVVRSLQLSPQASPGVPHGLVAVVSGGAVLLALTAGLSVLAP